MAETTTHIKSIVRVVLVTVFVLMVPLVAMQFTEEVNWGLEDFIIIGVLLIGTGLIYEFGVKPIRNSSYRLIAGVTLVVALFLIWAQLAVGLLEKLLTGR